MNSTAHQFTDTARAFDSVAPVYDGERGNNALVQIMRAQLWRALSQAVPTEGKLLDLGCGTGIDAVHFASLGYFITATDASVEMVAQTRARLTRMNLAEHVRVENIGIHELERLGVREFDGIYSDLGPLNCVQDLDAVAAQCAARLKPNGKMIVSVMGRHCPWEIAYYASRGNWTRARLRYAQGMVPVNLNDGVVWTRYQTPREFYRAFADKFSLVSYRALNLFLPPPYLIHWYERARMFMRPLEWLDARLGALPVLQHAGDHFLMVLNRTQ